MSFRLDAGVEPIAGYRLERLLGRGGFGEVWKAQAPGGFAVALKFIQLDTAHATPELRALEAVRAIRHPHLLEMHFAAQSGGWLVIATSLCDGSLWDRFQECRTGGRPGIPPDELLGYMAEAAQAIDFLNEPRHQDADGRRVGIQHRDIKPHNIFLTGGSVRVADFGLAKTLEQSLGSHTGCMSPSYAPPETYQGRVAAQSDQYSLAVSYCQLRGGVLPFVGGLPQLMYGHLHNDPDLSGLTDAERPVVARALAKNPSDRWPSCRAFVDQLRGRSIADTPPAPSLAPPPTPPARTTWAEWLIAGVASATGLAGLLFTGLLFLFAGSRETRVAAYVLAWLLAEFGTLFVCVLLIRRVRRPDDENRWFMVLSKLVLLCLLSAGLNLLPFGPFIALIVWLVGLRRLTGLDVFSAFVLSFILGVVNYIVRYRTMQMIEQAG